MRTLIIILMLFITSCKKNTPSLNGNEVLNNRLDTLIKFSDSKFSNIKLLDTILRNKDYFGTIDFDMDVDTIDFSNIFSRNLIFFSSMDDKSISFDEIGKTASSAAVIDSLQRGVFTFKFKVNSNKLGVNKIKIAVEDKMYLKSLNDSTPLKRRYYFVNIPFFIKDSI